MNRLLTYTHLPGVIAILLIGLSGFLGPLKAEHHAHTLESGSIQVGVGRVNITPDESIRLSGYGGRTNLPTGAAGQLWAKALAIGQGEETVLFVTLDLIGVPAWLKKEVIEKLDMPEAQIAMCATHTHSGPHLKNVLDPIFMADIPPDDWAGIERYSAALGDKVVRACRDALANREKGQLHWAQGEVGFAGNRRVLENGTWTGFGIQADGPVDHSLPVLKVSNQDDELLALLTNYACHCTTLGGDMNQYHGDWAGEAQRLLEERHPGTTAMIAIGCGADANPNPRGSMNEVLQHGKSLADEVDRIIGNEMKPLSQVPDTKVDWINLPFDPLPTREAWETHAYSELKTNYYAKQILNRLDAGETLPTSMDYPIQTWTFGDELAIVFLAGEVVVDYSIKLKERFDKDRIWITAYANAIPSYIASRRLYDEGGYEVDRSMLYYDKPQRLSPDTEELVLDEVLKQLPYPFYSEETLQRIPPPVEKDQTLSTLKVHEDLQVELVAAEPMVLDPIDVAWGPDGRMWVVEMADYPLGINDDGTPGGRIRVLEDLNGDGTYDQSTLFKDNIPYPTSVFPWKEGVLVTTPPDILYLRDTNGDGTADSSESLYTGFYLGNQQHLVNGMHWGLDGWIYLANGDSGGVIRSTTNDTPPIDINGLDLRIHPETGQFETILGRTQYGRNRDNWGNWFGNSNSWPGWHYALDDHYLKRNPHITYPNHRVFLPAVPQAGPVYPISRTLSRYNDYEKSNRFTSACGFMIYEDDALGQAFMENSFVAEPVHNLVSRAVLQPQGSSFYSRRASEENNSEFLASTDNWFRPVSVRSGPDGALYVVDMYRLVIEHPEWVPLDWQRKLNLREGHDKGRIYRITRKGYSAPPVPDLTELSADRLVAAIDSLNRWQRDSAQQLLLWQKATGVQDQLKSLVSDSIHPEARSQALWTLNGLGTLDSNTLLKALSDTDSRVRLQAVKLSDSFLEQSPELLSKVLAQIPESDPSLKQQLAYTLGESSSPQAADALVELLLNEPTDVLLQAAALSSMVPHMQRISTQGTTQILATQHEALIQGFYATLVGSGNDAAIAASLPSIFGSRNPFIQAAWFLETLRRKNLSLKSLHDRGSQALQKQLQGSQIIFDKAERLANSDTSDLGNRRAALRLLAYPQLDKEVDRSLFLNALSPDSPVEVQQDVLKHLERNPGANLAKDLVSKWDSLGPSTRKSIVQTLLKRSNWTRSLLSLAREQTALTASFSTSQIASLSTHQDPTIRNLAAQVFKAKVSEDRLQTIENYQSALTLPGDPVNGRAVFSAQCSICHRMDDLGFHVGPDLSALSDRSPESMLTGILDPNRAVEDKFSLYTVTTTTGAAGAGIISTETSNSISLLNAGGLEQTFLRSEIQSLDGGSSSLMPEGLELGIGHQAMADLLAFLGASHSKPHIEADSSGSYSLSAKLGSFTGPSAFLNTENGSIDFISDKDFIQWTVTDLKAGYYDIFSNAGLGQNYQGRPFTLSMNDTFVTGVISYSGDMGRYRQRKFGNILIEQDLPSAVFKLQHRLDGAVLSLIELKLIPAE